MAPSPSPSPSRNSQTSSQVPCKCPSSTRPASPASTTLPSTSRPICPTLPRTWTAPGPTPPVSSWPRTMASPPDHHDANVSPLRQRLGHLQLPQLNPAGGHLGQVVLRLLHDPALRTAAEDLRYSYRHLRRNSSLPDRKSTRLNSSHANI